MDHVIIGDGAQVLNCVLASNCQVASGIALRDCVLGGSFEATTDLKSVRLSNHN